MEVMPIYQNCLLMHNIIVGMICLNELKFYSLAMIAGITISAVCCIFGILFLLEKNREKLAAVNSMMANNENESESEEMENIDKAKKQQSRGGKGFESLNRKGSSPLYDTN